MLDINGQELRQGKLGLLLCEILDLDGEGARVRILNSDMELYVGARHDEALGGLVADSELTAFVEAEPTESTERDRAEAADDGMALEAFE
jgi:hypothetical protein